MNGANGGPTPGSFTDAVFDRTKTLEQYTIVEAPAIPLEAPGLHSIGAMQVEVVDGIDDFVALMQQLFDFDQIRDLIRSDFALAFDAMHAVTAAAPMPPVCSKSCWAPPAASATEHPWKTSARLSRPPTSPTPTIWLICFYGETHTASGRPATVMATAT